MSSICGHNCSKLRGYECSPCIDNLNETKKMNNHIVIKELQIRIELLQAEKAKNESDYNNLLEKYALEIAQKENLKQRQTLAFKALKEIEIKRNNVFEREVKLALEYLKQ